jgi:adenylate kinase
VAAEANGSVFGDFLLRGEDGRIAIIMIGPPGAGKGTQARMIGEALKCPHISTGDMLREALKGKTELGKRAEHFMESGGLVPDELVNGLIAKRLGFEDCRRGFILDGYPRAIPQAEFLQSLFAKDNTTVFTIGIEVEDRILIERLSSRWTCSKCGKIFNAYLDSGKAGGRCDECGTALIQRKDDAAEVIAERLQVYYRTTRPLIQYYRKQDAYIAVDGDKPADEVFSAILGILKGRIH